MSSRARALAERREALIARSREDRAAVAAAMDAVERELVVADLIVSAARAIRRHRAAVGIAAAGLILEPVAARTWIRRAAGFVPLVMEGYRLARSLREMRRGRRREELE